MRVARTGLFLFGASEVPGLQPLPGVLRDARRIWRAMVQGRHGPGLMDGASSRRMVDEPSEDVRDGLKAFCEELGPNALAVVYFVGHARMTGSGDDLELLCASSGGTTAGLRASTIVQYLQDAHIAEWAIILDCCDAGVAASTIARHASAQDQQRGYVVASATRRGPALETTDQGGWFTHSLVDAIRSARCMPDDADYVKLTTAVDWVIDQAEPNGIRPTVYSGGSGGFRIARARRLIDDDGLPGVRSVLFVGALPKTSPSSDVGLPALEVHAQQALHTIGARLADWGITLRLCNLWSKSADYRVALGYASARGPGGVLDVHTPDLPGAIASVGAFESVKDDDGVDVHRVLHPAVGGDDLAEPLTWLYCQTQALEGANDADRVDAVIALGGEPHRSMNLLLRFAEGRGIPLVPLAFFGGAAKAAFDRRRGHFDSLGISATLLRRNGVESLGRLLTAVCRPSPHHDLDMGRIFVSRSSYDAKHGECIGRHLRALGLVAGFGDALAPDDRAVKANIADWLTLADGFIALWSESYATSANCFDELEHAIERFGDAVWLLRLDDTPVTLRAARGLKQHIVKTRAAQQAAIEAIFGSVAAIDDAGEDDEEQEPDADG